MTNPSGPKHRWTLRNNYLPVLGAAVFILLSFGADAQVFPLPSTNYALAPAKRISVDSAFYGPTACGIPTDSTYLFSYGFGQGQILKKFAIYYDSCGHHLYLWDPALKAWHIGDSTSGGGGSGVVTFNTRSGAVTLTLSDVTTALTFVPISRVLGPGQLLIGNGSSIATAFTVTGDLSFSSSGVGTINAHAVINSKLAQMSAHTYKGNNTESTADPADVTNTQLTADLNTFGTTTKGLVPSPGSVTGLFLGDDGAWHSAGAGSGNTNSNVGSDFRWAIPSTNNIKTFHANPPLNLDSSSNANALTVKADTTTLITGLVTKAALRDSSAKFVTSMGINGTMDSIFWFRNGVRMAFKIPNALSPGVSARWYSAGYDSAGNLTARGPKFVDVVRDFGADTTFTNDCTVSFQAAIIMAYLLKGATVWVPTGHYKFSGAFDSGHGNCQVWIPAQNPFTDSSYGFINIIGEGVNNILGGGYNPGAIPPIPNTGVRIQSTIAGTGSWPKIFGTYAVGGAFNYTRIYLKNLAILAYTNHATIAPTTGSFGFAKAATISADYCTATLDTLNQVSIDPVSSESYGFALGNRNNSGPNIFHGLISTGTKYLYITSEHSTYIACHAYVGTNAVVAPAVSYALKGEPILAHGCNWQLYIPTSTLLGEYSPGESYLDLTLELEHNTYTGPTKWYNYVGDVKDSSNFGRGIVRYTIQDGAGGPHPWIVYGNQKIEFIDLFTGYALPHAFGRVGAIPIRSGTIGSTNGFSFTTMPSNSFYVDSTNKKYVINEDGSAISPLELLNLQSVTAGQGLHIKNITATAYANATLENSAGHTALLALTGTSFATFPDQLRIANSGGTGGINFLPLGTGSDIIFSNGSGASANRSLNNGHFTFNTATDHFKWVNINGGIWINKDSIPILTAPSTMNLVIDTITGIVSRQNGSGGAGSPGGSDTYMQFNNAGAFGGDAGNVWDNTNKVQTITSAAATEGFRSISTNTSGTGHGNIYAQNTSSASQTTIFMENNRGSLASGISIQAGGSANANTIFSFSKADIAEIISFGASNTGLAIGTSNTAPMIFGTSGSERARIFSNGNVQIGGTTDIPSAKFSITSVTQAFLPPRMNTTQQNAISSPANGSLIWNTDTTGLCVYINSTFTWRSLFTSVNLPGGGGSAPFSDGTALVKNSGDATKQLKLSAASITTATTRTATFPDADITVADKLSGLNQFAATTSAQLAGVLSDETGTGAAVFSASPALTGIPTTPTATAGTGGTQIASQAYADASSAAAVAGVTSSVKFTETADNTITNTSSATSLIGTGTGSLTMPANSLATGKTLIIKGIAYLSTAASPPSMQFVFVDAGNAFNITTSTLSASLTDAPVEYEFTLTSRNAGSSGTIQVDGWVSINGVKLYGTSASQTLNTTTTANININAVFSAASTSNTLVTKTCRIIIQ